VREVNGNRENVNKRCPQRHNLVVSNTHKHTKRRPIKNEVVVGYKMTYHLADEEDDTHGCPYGTTGWA